MKTTISDIARKLGVTPSTVSLALRDSAKISAKTTEKVKQTAHEMGYRRNPYISILMSARRQGRMPKNKTTIAFITASEKPDGWTERYTSREFHAGCSNVAMSLGIKLETFWIGEKSMSAERMNDILYNRGIYGAILLPTGTLREKMNHDWKHIAAVSYGIYELSPPVDRVKADHYGNMENVLAELTKKGFERIGFTMDIPYPYANQNRWLAAYLMYSRDLGVRKRLLPFLDDNPTFLNFKAWLEKQKPDVVICIDPVKMGKWFEQAGVRVPDDIGMVALSSAREGEAFSGIIEDGATGGKLAFEMLLDRIHHNEFHTPESPRVITVRGRWYPGTTLQAPAAKS